MIVDRESNVWIGTDRGLLRVNARGVSRLDARSGRAGDRALRGPRGQPLDRDARRARATARQQLHHLRRGGGRASEGQRAGPRRRGRPHVARALDRRSLLAPERARGPGRRRRARATPSCTRSPAASSDVWVGRRERRTDAALLRRAIRCARGRIGTADGLGSASVYAVHESRDGTVWAGALGGGVSRFREGRFTSYGVRDGLASDTVTSIADGADGTTWFATPNGLSALSGERWRTYTDGRRLALERRQLRVRGLRGRRSGSGPATVSRSSPAIASRCRPAFRRRCASRCSGLAEDRQGGLWIATARQVLRARLGDLAEGHARRGRGHGVRTLRRAPGHRDREAAPVGGTRSVRPHLVLDEPAACRWSTPCGR